MKYLKFLRTYVCLLLGFAAFTACTSDEEEALIPEGKGYVKLSLNADAGFQTKAVDESEYRDVNNYTVQIINNSTNILVNQYTGESLPEELIELDNGGYTVKAFYGQDVPASTTSMYVEGSTIFNINSNTVENVAVTCTPVCARVTIVEDETLKNYFKNWKATFKTVALEQASYDYDKGDDPVYLKVSNEEKVTCSYQFTKNDGTIIELEGNPYSYTLSPNKAMKITLKPLGSVNGQLGITVEIDGTVTEHVIDITIPSDWV